MEIMEKLYNRGFLSYPRTETNKYNKTIDLHALVGKHQGGPSGEHVDAMLNGDMWAGPRHGSKDDQAHPPIHPVKLAAQNQMDSPRHW